MLSKEASPTARRNGWPRRWQNSTCRTPCEIRGGRKTVPDTVSSLTTFPPLQAVLPVSLALALPISLDRFRVGLPVLAKVIGMAVAPFLLAVPADLVVLGIGVKLAAVIFPTALPLAIRPTASKLVGVIAGELKDLLAVAAAAITHQAAPNRDASRPL